MKNKKIYAGILISLGVGIGGLSLSDIGTDKTEEAQIFYEEPLIILNQGLGLGLNKEDGTCYPMDLLVAQRPTGLYVKAAPELFDGMLDESEYLVVSGDMDKTIYAKNYDEESGLFDFSDPYLNWEEGEYHITLYLNDIVAERDVTFRAMKDIRVWVVPISALYSGEWAGVDAVPEDLDDFTRKVYPLGSDDLEWRVPGEDDMQTVALDYELNSALGRYLVWKWLCGQENEEEQYDLILGLVPFNMYANENSDTADITGFTFGENVSVISLADTSPSVTVAHEIGHCYMFGDEYENGTVNMEMNMIPYGMKGRDMQDLNRIVFGDCEYIVSGAGNGAQGTGTLVYKEQYPFDIDTRKIITHNMTSFMGLAGYEESEYWTTTDIWTEMYHALAE